jgi:hypothetical protein
MAGEDGILEGSLRSHFRLVECRDAHLRSPARAKINAAATMTATEIIRLLMSFFGGDLTQRFSYASREVSLSDCASTIIYSRRRKIFLEAHWVTAASHRGSYRVVAELGRTAGSQRAVQGT